MVKQLVKKKPTDALILDYFLVFHSNYEEVEEQLSEPERYGKRRDPFVELLSLLAYAKVMKRIGLTRSVWPLAQSYFGKLSFVFYALPALEPLRARLRVDPPRDLVRIIEKSIARCLEPASSAAPDEPKEEQ